MFVVAMKKQQGVALITVLFIVALTALLATKMTGNLMLQTQRSSNIAFNQQAYWYAIGAEAFAKSILDITFKDEPEVTHLDQYWAQGQSTYPVEYGEVTGEIFDLQACFNLNALRDNASGSGSGSGSAATNKPIAWQSFKNLVIKLALEDVEAYQAENMADALTDWLDADSNISSNGGAEDSDYAGKAFPYLAANHYLASVNELRVIEHFSAKVITELKKYVCVLPDTSLHQVNINTIDPENAILLAALLDIPTADAENMLSERADTGYNNIDDFFTSRLVTNANISDLENKKTQFAIDSAYFKLTTMASFNKSFFHLNTVFNVASNQKDLTIIARSIGKE
jgi:general secretion pathway protein K